MAGERLPSGYFGCALSEEFRSYDEDEPHFTDLTLDPPSGHDCGSGRWLVIAPFVDGHVQTPTGSTVLPDAATYYGFADGIIQRTETADRNADKRYQAAVAACLSKR